MPVYTLQKKSPEASSQATDIQTFYHLLAQTTGGQAFQLDRTEQIPPVVQQLVSQTVSRIQTLRLEVPESKTAWLQNTPAVYHDVALLESRKFFVELCPPSGTASGEYIFQLALVGDKAILQEIPVHIQVLALPQRSQIPWWILLPPLLLLIPSLLFWQSRSPANVAIASPRPVRRATGSQIGGPQTGQTVLSNTAPKERRAGADVTYRDGQK